MSLNLLAFVVVFLFLWLSLLTFLLYGLYLKVIKPLRKSKTGDLIQLMQKVLDIQKVQSKEIKDVKNDLENFHDESKIYVQKVGLVRFNPFNETGGDHSFSLSLLNAKETGVVITGLHTRERTRLYLKPIIKGKSEYELSKEEKEAIEKARKES